MGYKIYAPKPICDSGMRALKEKGFEFIGTGEGSPEDLKKYVPEADVIIARVHFFGDELLATAKHLKMVMVHGVGYQDHIVCEDAAKRGIYVSYSPYGNYRTVAEGCAALTMAMTCNIRQYDKGVRTPKGIRPRMRMELEGATIGLLGVGNIARAYAEKMYYGMGCKIVGYKRTHDDTMPYYIHMLDSMDEVFKVSDVVSLHIPGEPKYKGMINKYHFDLMKDGSYFVNTARNVLVNNDDLYDALKSGHLAGAAADVDYSEHPDGQKLLELDNFINTPHAMAFSEESLERSGNNCVQEICRTMLDGKPPVYWVNREGFVPQK